MVVSNADSQSHQIYFNDSPQAPQKSLQRQQSPQEISPEDKKQIEELKKRDTEVRRHEQAHKAAAGKYAMGAPGYEYQTGPDGKQYAVGGEVQIDTSEVPDDPEATIKKAQQIKRAALAPKDPSSQDRKIAAEASRMEAKARMELAKQRQEEKQVYDRNGEKAEHPVQPAVVDLFI